MDPIGLGENETGPAGRLPVFTYGSLMFAPVWERVVAGRYRAAGATLRGFLRLRIRGESYPALVPGPPSAVVRGVVYFGVSATDLTALDHFEAEGVAYARVRVAVEPDGGERVEAWTYRYLLAHRLEPTEWDPRRFREHDLPRFLRAHCSPRAPERPSAG